jgi:hypothetical protein
MPRGRKVNTGPPQKPRRPAMTPSELRLLGQHTYGAEWQSELAADLSLHRVTVARWAAGTSRIQNYFAEKVRACCRWRINRKVAEVRRTIRRKNPLQDMNLDDFDQPTFEDSPSPEVPPDF